MNLHLVLSDLISWQYLLLLMIGFLFFLWLIWGGRDDLEYVGLKPFLNKDEESEDDEEDRENSQDEGNIQNNEEIVEDINKEKENKENKENVIEEINFTPRIPKTLSENFSMGFSEDEGDFREGNFKEGKEENFKEGKYKETSAPIIDIESYDSFSDILNPVKSPNSLALGEHKMYNSGKISKGEALCKKAIEDIYNMPFHCVRPDFLKNPETGRNLELDMYNDSLKIAVEYNHIQHYIYPNSFHKTHEEFMNQIRRDKFKIEACDRNGVYLITVPYNVPLNYIDIRKYIEYYLPENVAKRSGVDLIF